MPQANVRNRTTWRSTTVKQDDMLGDRAAVRAELRGGRRRTHAGSRQDRQREGHAASRACSFSPPLEQKTDEDANRGQERGCDLALWRWRRSLQRASTASASYAALRRSTVPSSKSGAQAGDRRRSGDQAPAAHAGEEEVPGGRDDQRARTPDPESIESRTRRAAHNQQS